MEGDNLALTIDDELGPAPWNILSLLSLRIEQLAVSAEEPVDRVRVCTVDFDLREKQELCLVLASSKLYDISLCAWFLAPELIAGERKDLESSLTILLVQLD